MREPATTVSSKQPYDDCMIIGVAEANAGCHLLPDPTVQLPALQQQSCIFRVSRLGLDGGKQTCAGQHMTAGAHSTAPCTHHYLLGVPVAVEKYRILFKSCSNSDWPKSIIQTICQILLGQHCCASKAQPRGFLRVSNAQPLDTLRKQQATLPSCGKGRCSAC
jgi:hypothetical protein